MRTVMSKIIALIAIMGVLALNTGCVVVEIGGNWSGTHRVEGTGKVLTESFDVSEYSNVKVLGDVKIVYNDDGAKTVELQAHENILELMDIQVSDNTLFIGAKDKQYFSTTSNATPVVTIHSSRIEKIKVEGGLTMEESDTFRGDSLLLDIDGGANIAVNVDVKTLQVNIDGGGDILAKGKAENFDIDIDGAGDISAFDLETKNTTISINGAGSAKVSCSDELDVNISGAGDVEYKGSPHVSQNVNGAGDVTQVS